MVLRRDRSSPSWLRGAQRRRATSRLCGYRWRVAACSIERDEASGRPILLSEGLAQRLWPDGRDPIGRLVRLGDNPPFTVTGVVGEVRQLALNEDPTPTVYLPTSWYVSRETMIVVMRATGEPAQLAPALRRAVARLDQQQPVFAVRTLVDLLDDGSARERLNAFLVGSFALLALALGVVGVGGVVSYSVIHRTPEMAVRMALGATPGQVVRAVAAGGLRIGLLGTLGRPGWSICARAGDGAVSLSGAAGRSGDLRHRRSGAAWGGSAGKLVASSQDCPHRSRHRTPAGVTPKPRGRALAGETESSMQEKRILGCNRHGCTGTPGKTARNWETRNGSGVTVWLPERNPGPNSKRRIWAERSSPGC